MIAGFLKGLKGNLFGGKGSTGFSRPAPTKTQNIFSLPPTSTVDSDPLSFGTYQFPQDVFENQQLGHYMVFYVNKTNRSKYYYGEGNPYDGMDNEEQAEFDAAGAGLKQYGYNGLRSHAKRLKIARNKKTGTNRASDGSDLSKSNRNSAALQGFSSSRKTTTRISDSIALYLPANVAETTSASYEDTPTGVIGFAAEKIIDAVTAGQARDFEKGAKIGFEALSTVAQEIFKNLGGGFIEALTGTEGVVPLANKVFGRAENPFVEVFFNSMNVRTFTYNFNFAPRNEAETMEIQQIIQLFRFHMAPEIQASNTRYLTLPSEFDIHYMYKAEDGASYENDFYGRIGTCVLTDVATNHTPNGVKSFADGAPTQITMSLTFRETELLTKEKINQGY